MKFLSRMAAVGLMIFAVTPVYADQMDDLAKMQEFMKVMHGYYGIIHDVHGVASNPEKAAIMQLQKIEEIYKKRGDRAEAIAVLSDVVNTTKNATVRNAAAMMLADALNETGRASEAVEVLRAALDSNLR
ncbi:MAG: hypothetical protein O7C67_04845 [Gammaproteobacteria bacterium]|nr:hypothetical protein [Gammaproteobacteria bacterium]